MLLRLDCLVQSIGITAARHDTSGKLIDNENLIVFYYIVLITEHQVVCAQSQDDIVLDLKILRICQVLNMEELLYLLNAFLSQVNDFIFLIYNEVAGLLDVLAHDGIHLGELAGCLTAYQLMSQHITYLVKLCGFAALAGNDQRSSCFIDQDGIHLIDDGIIQIAQNHLVLVDCHVVTQVIKAQLVIGNVGDVAVVSSLTLLRGHRV